MVIAVATIEAELARVRARLADFGARSVEVVAPGEIRRVVLATVDDGTSGERIAVALRAEGELAVTRPDGGAELQAWFRDTRTITIGDRLSVCLAWSEHDRTGLPGLIELGPGGFGSGHHPTTMLILEELVERVTGGERVLDVGCGSAILGLGALRLGAAGAVGVDVKSDAIDAARRNAALNEMEVRLEATLAPLAEIVGTFDVVVANIARAGIVALAADLVSSVSPDGWLAVSGITPSQCAQVAGFLLPLVEVERRTSGEWSAVVLARP